MLLGGVRKDFSIVYFYFGVKKVKAETDRQRNKQNI